MLPDNLPVINAWHTAARTQWRLASVGMAGAIRAGLDYAGVLAALQTRWPGKVPRLFSGIQVIEAEFLACDYARRTEGDAHE